jgi:diguanylate cyclase (GGDEF)-like protein
MIHKIRASMSAKVALIVTVPVVLITSFFSYHHYSHDRISIFHNAEVQLLRIGEGLKGPVEVFLKKNEVAGLSAMVVETARGTDIELITVVNGQGRVVASNKKEWDGKEYLSMHPGLMTERDVQSVQKALAGGYSIYFDPEDMQYCLVMPLDFGRGGTGAVHISLDIKTTEAEVWNRGIENFAISAAVAALMGITIYFLFYYQFTRRIKAVSTAAVKIASGDMQVRASARGADEIGYLATSFNLLADEITNWRNNLEGMVSSRLKELTVLYEVVDAISRSLELNRVLPSVLERVLDNLGAGKGAVVLAGSDGKTFKLMADQGLSEEALRQISLYGRGGVGDVILGKKPLRTLSGDEKEGAPGIPGLEQDNIRSALVVPIIVRDNVFGAFAVYSGKGDRFSEQDEALLTTIGNQVGVAVENSLLYEKTLELARVDGLTGAATRRFLMERLKQEIDRADRYQTSLSILMLDLDKFKSFNDTYGHPKGDELLKSFSFMVMSMVRSTDIAGRYGGEEFCVILPNTSIKGAAVIAERIRKSMEELRISPGDDRPAAGRTVSIGVAEFSAGQTVEKLLSDADAALYRAKEGGRNRVVW